MFVIFKNKTEQGNNMCGNRIHCLRVSAIPKMSQRLLAEKLQLMGIDVDKNAIQRMECGKRFVTDIELFAISRVFNVSCDYLLDNSQFKPV